MIREVICCQKQKRILLCTTTHFICYFQNLKIVFFSNRKKLEAMGDIRIHTSNLQTCYLQYIFGPISLIAPGAKLRNSGPIPDLLSHFLLFNEMSRYFLCPLTFDKQYSKMVSLKLCA